MTLRGTWFSNDYWERMGSKEMTELRFNKTCDACPEQYDVFNEDKMVGYVRLRHGHLYVSCPDVGGEIVYEATIGDGVWDGQFENEAQRAYHLDEAEIAIKNWMKGQKENV